MSDENAAGDLSDLARSLAELVRDPDRVAALYGSLGDQCHRWRNMLNALKLSLHLARRACGEAERAFWAEVDVRYRTLETFLEDLQFVCRPADLKPIRIPLGAFVADRRATWTERVAARGGTLDLATDPPAATAAVVDLDLLRMTRAFDAFVAWRAEAAAPGPFRLAVCAEGPWARLDWREGRAGPRAAAAEPPGNPSSLALPMLARVLALHGGDLEARRDGGPALYRFRMPLATACGGGPT